MFKARSTKASNERTIAFDLHFSRKQKRHKFHLEYTTSSLCNWTSLLKLFLRSWEKFLSTNHFKMVWNNPNKNSTISCSKTKLKEYS